MNRLEFDKIEGDGKIASCEFITKPNKEFPNGRLRKMVFRTKVTKGVTGEGMKYDPNKLGLRTVFDMQKRDFRMINLNTLQTITAHGKTHQWYNHFV